MCRYSCTAAAGLVYALDFVPATPNPSSPEISAGNMSQGPTDIDSKSILDSMVAQAGRIILGKEQVIRLALACLLAKGHLLIEDLPGVGKTTLAHLLARLLGLHYQRIQFTSDLLPADIIGVSVYDRERALFRFHPGPVFFPAGPGRRNQPRDTQGAERTAGGDGGAAGDGRGRNPQAS